jgi:putative membrane protein
MILLLPVDLDDDLGRKTGVRTPVIGRDAVEEAAVKLATADPEDSDVNVLFQAINAYEDLLADPTLDEEVAVAAVTGVNDGDVKANRAVGEEIDTVLAALSTGEEVRAIVITDGAQDESVLPVIRSRVPLDGVRRVVVRQAQDLESIYYTMKQVLSDPETRGTILIPLGVLLLVYPFSVIAGMMNLPGAVVFGAISTLLGLYSLWRGLGLEEAVDGLAERARTGLYAGRVTIVTYLVAATLLIIGGVQGIETLSAAESAAGAGSGTGLSVTQRAAVFVHASVQWAAAAGITSSLGQVTDEYLADRFQWRYLNAPFYVVAIAIVLYGLSGYFLPGLPSVETAPLSLTRLAVTLTTGTLLGVLSTLTFAVAESRYPQGGDGDGDREAGAV